MAGQQANRLDLHAEQTHIDALTLDRTFAIVGTDKNNAARPLVTVESRWTSTWTSTHGPAASAPR
ncbi:hypothetical protein ACFVG9_21450 [Saccharothrix carnea]|uniref:hypothetical protein n=1 Tax=Saccharothrix carnea TaxID=1280637 RepID=UPI00093E9997|nr:hypothetical protein A6A25_30780 [Saccharothrix sp. CB00851]